MKLLSLGGRGTSLEAPTTFVSALGMTWSLRAKRPRDAQQTQPATGENHSWLRRPRRTDGRQFLLLKSMNGPRRLRAPATEKSFAAPGCWSQAGLVQPPPMISARLYSRRCSRALMDSSRRRRRLQLPRLDLEWMRRPEGGCCHTRKQVLTLTDSNRMDSISCKRKTLFPSSAKRIINGSGGSGGSSVTPSIIAIISRPCCLS